MLRRSIIAGAIALAAAGVAVAQVAPQARSERRVQVSKGEVALPRVDTVYVVRIDTA